MVRNRIKQFREVDAASLIPNPQNWREHPKFQRRVMEGVLAEVGNVDVLKCVETDAGLMLIDGHLRAQVMQGGLVTVAVLDLDEAEQAVVLATFDPISALAQRGVDAFMALAGSVKTTNPDIARVVEAVANENYVSLQVLPRDEDPDFAPGDGSNQGQLDQVAQIQCPGCGLEFTP